MTKILIIIIVIALVIYFVLRGNNTKERELERFLFFWVIVPPGYEYIRFFIRRPYKNGENGVMKVGYNYVIPGIHSVEAKVLIMVQDLDLTPVQTFLADGIEGEIIWYVRFRVKRSDKFSFSHVNLKEAIEHSAKKIAKNELGEVTTKDSMQKTLNDKFKESLGEFNEIFSEYGIEIICIEVTDINLPEPYVASLQEIKIKENKAKADRIEEEAKAEIRKLKAKASAEANYYMYLKEVEVAKRMQEEGIDPKYLGVILREHNINNALELDKVTKMIVPSSDGSSNNVVGIATMKNIMEEV